MPQTITVLVVEDEPLIRLDIALALEDLGFKVFEAGNAREALVMLEIHADIQVMFTDVDMPGDMDGLALAAAVRRKWPPIKIIVTSGRSTVDSSDMPAESRFFAKPYRASDIATAAPQMMAH